MDEPPKQELLILSSKFLQSPTRLNSLYLKYDSLQGTIWHAEYRGIIDESHNAQCRFLTMMFLHYNDAVIDEQLKGLASDYQFNGSVQQLPTPLRYLVQNYHADKRNPLSAAFFLD